MLKATSSIVNVSQITGVLPVINGGTGVTTSTGTGSTVLSAAPTLSGNVTLSTGNLIVASGQGIDFSATPGTGTSELLADYEEGTWTPTVSGVTLVNSSGRYTKVGRQVFVSFDIEFPVNSNATAITIAALPFTAAANSGALSTAYTTYTNLLNGICGTAGIAVYGFMGNPASAPQNIHMSGLRLIASAVYTV